VKPKAIEVVQKLKDTQWIGRTLFKMWGASQQRFTDLREMVDFLVDHPVVTDALLVKFKDRNLSQREVAKRIKMDHSLLTKYPAYRPGARKMEGQATLNSQSLERDRFKRKLNSGRRVKKPNSTPDEENPGFEAISDA
jgi:hypothetical protein